MIAAEAANNAAAAQESWGQRMAGGVKRVITGAWTGVKRFVNWLGRKVASAARWVRDKTVSAYEYLRDKVVKPAARWVRDTAPKVWNKALELAKRAWNWTRSAVSRLWVWAAPARTWIATPFRSTMGVASLATLAFFGARALIVLAIPVAIFSLLASTSKPKAKLDAGESIIDPKDQVLLNTEQAKGLAAREEKVRAQGELYMDKADKNMQSEYMGRSFVLQHRVLGGMTKTSKLKVDFKAAQLEKYGAEKCAQMFIWASANRGIDDEHLVVEGILKANADQAMVPVS